MLTIALRLERVEWLEQFLEEHKDKMPPEYEDRDNVYRYSLVRLRIEQEKFDDALGTLNQVVSVDFFTNMDVRRALLMVYYEMEYTDMFESEVNRFRVYLTNNQNDISLVHLQAYRDFNNIINNIYKTMKRDQDRLENQINNTQILPERKWLLEKLQEKR